VPVHAMKAYGGKEVWHHSFLTSTLDERAKLRYHHGICLYHFMIPLLGIAFYLWVLYTLSIPVAARSKEWSAAIRLLGLRVRIPPGRHGYVSCECCVLSGRGLCGGLIARPEESYRMWCV
jgi:hypothetical protein